MTMGCSGQPPEDAASPQAEAPTDDAREDTVEFWKNHRAGMDARRQGRWTAAVAAFRRALEIRPEHETTHYYLASALFETGHHAEAVAHWEAILVHHPMSSRANVQLAAVHAIPDLLDLFDLDRARAHLERALELNREETGPLIRLGEVEVARGNESKGRELLEQARLTNPRAASAHYLCAYLSWKAGDEAQAQQDLKLALDALAVTRQAQTPMLEGDIRVGDMETMARETMSSRRLFAPLLHDLREGGETSVATEAGKVSAYLKSLPTATGASPAKAPRSGSG